MAEIIRGIEQGSEEWLRLRLGRLTASHAQEIANWDNPRSKGKGLDTLCRLLAAQLFTGIVNPDAYKDATMQRGNDEEHLARAAYELESGQDVEQVTFGIWNDYVGASPDGLVGSDGGCEFKRKTFAKHADVIFSDGADFEDGYVWQCHMNMLVFGRNWWDLCSFNPEFGARALFVRRIQRDPIADERLLGGFARGEELIKYYLGELHENDKR